MIYKVKSLLEIKQNNSVGSSISIDTCVQLVCYVNKSMCGTQIRDCAKLLQVDFLKHSGFYIAFYNMFLSNLGDYDNIWPTVYINKREKIKFHVHAVYVQLYATTLHIHLMS